MKITVYKKVHFDSAHHLSWHKGLCKNIHGHRYFLEIGVTGEINENGIVMDFGDIKKILNEYVKTLDHKNLNDIFENPTAEIMAQTIFETLIKEIPQLTVVRLWETPESCAEVKI